jgi:hypothetical protein
VDTATMLVCQIMPLLELVKVEPFPGGHFEFEPGITNDGFSCYINVTLHGLLRAEDGSPGCALEMGPVIIRSMEITDEQILELLFEYCADALVHELAEQFKVGNLRIFDPHKRAISTTYAWD